MIISSAADDDSMTTCLRMILFVISEFNCRYVFV